MTASSQGRGLTRREVEDALVATDRERARLLAERDTLRAQRDELAAALAATLPALIRLGDFVGNVDEGGPSNQGRIDRCTLILAVRAALAKLTGK